jgi:hypothetical protein
LDGCSRRPSSSGRARTHSPLVGCQRWTLRTRTARGSAGRGGQGDRRSPPHRRRGQPAGEQTSDLRCRDGRRRASGATCSA